MKTLIKIKQWFIDLVKNNVLWTLAIVAAAVFIGSYALAIYNKAEQEVFPIGYLLKVPFAILAASIGTWASILFIEYGLPDSFDKINTKTEGGITACTDWQQVIYTLFFIAEFAFIFSIALFAL